MRILFFATLIALSGPTLSSSATSAAVKEVAQDLVCLCGDCNRESLATCLCGFAASLRQELNADLDAGRTRQQIIDQFVEQFGPVVLATPPAQGYNLLAWIAPAAALILGIAMVRSVLLSWRRSPTATPGIDSTSNSNDAETTEYEDRLRRELDRFDNR